MTLLNLNSTKKSSCGNFHKKLLIFTFLTLYLCITTTEQELIKLDLKFDQTVRSFFISYNLLLDVANQCFNFGKKFKHKIYKIYQYNKYLNIGSFKKI